jgi:uncharacterized protein YndB with AHSA1/START domain
LYQKWVSPVSNGDPVRHWAVADRETHEKMGFHAGWGRCADQLVALVEKS